MSSYPQPRSLTRSRDDRVIAGVCGGLAKYLNLDASVVRIGVAVISLFTGVGLIAYVIAALVVPEEGSSTNLWQQNTRFGAKSDSTGPTGAATSPTPATPTDPLDPTDPIDPTAPTGPIYGERTDTDNGGADLR